MASHAGRLVSYKTQLIVLDKEGILSVTSLKGTKAQ
jgi:hypothetical protein